MLNVPLVFNFFVDNSYCGYLCECVLMRVLVVFRVWECPIECPIFIRDYSPYYLILAGVLSFHQQKESTKESAGAKKRSTLEANARPPFWRIAKLLYSYSMECPMGF